MSEKNVELVRLPLAVSDQPRRRVVERLALRFPGVAAFLTRTVLRLPPTSRLRQALIRYFTQQGTAALNRGDYEAVFRVFYAADCEFDPGPRLLMLGLTETHGREDRIRFQQRWIAEWGEFRFQPDEIIDLADGRRLMMLGRVKGSGLSSGAAFDDEWGVLFTLAAGQVIREQAFFDHAEALEAAGLSK
jgi:ketosteroid isomerase-like protein